MGLIQMILNTIHFRKILKEDFSEWLELGADYFISTSNSNEDHSASELDNSDAVEFPVDDILI